MRVLYVDDDRVNALLFVEVCRLAPGVVVDTVENGVDALEQAAAFAPDLLVIDLHLPDTTGTELLPRLHAALKRPVPAVLCTADERSRVADTARAAGFVDCWTKPVDPQALIAELARLAVKAE